MMEARWPNAPLAPVMEQLTVRAEAGQGTDYDILCDPALPQGDFSGARVLIWPGSMWNNAVRKVADYQPGKSFRFDPPFEVSDDKYHTARPLSAQADQPLRSLRQPVPPSISPASGFTTPRRALSLSIFPESASPQASVVEVRSRDYGFDLSGLAHIQIEGIRLFAAAINMRDARHCLVQNCMLRWVDHFSAPDGYRIPEAKNLVSGADNTWEHCRITGAAGAAIRLIGSGNRVVNCIIEEANYLGVNCAAVACRRLRERPDRALLHLPCRPRPDRARPGQGDPHSLQRPPSPEPPQQRHRRDLRLEDRGLRGARSPTTGSITSSGTPTESISTTSATAFVSTTTSSGMPETSA